MLSNKLWRVFMGIKQKKQKFAKKNFKMADSKKLSFSTTTKSWAIAAKISWIGPWVSRIDWCEGHWCGSTYMVVRLSYISSKTGKKCIFCVFRLFLSLCWTAWWPYQLSHNNALRIISSYEPKDQSLEKKFQKKWELAELENELFFRGPFWIFFQKKPFFLVFF